MRRDEVAQCHKLGQGYIMEFLYRSKGTTFDRLLSANPEMSEKKRINISLKIKLSAYDLKIQNKAKKLVEDGEADDFYTDLISGKIVLLRNNVRTAMSVMADVEKYSAHTF